MTVTRIISAADAPELADLVVENREFMRPFEPPRTESFFTAEGQLAAIEDALDRHAQGATLPHVITDSGRIAGRITLNGIVRGPFLSCSVGYWVSQDANGRGLATAALREILGIAFGRLGCTGSRPRRCSTTPPRSACWPGAGSSASAWLPSTCTSAARGRITSCSSC